MKSSRFLCASSSLSLVTLIRSARKSLWAGLIVATVLHGILVLIKSGGVEQKVAKQRELLRQMDESGKED